jgi:proteasome activator subunit 4
LAEQNTGCIDWEPYLPAMFARVLKMFNLPVRYNKTSVGGKGTQLDSQTAARWIVSTLGGGSQTQHYLSRLLLSIESYYHPANIGR